MIAETIMASSPIAATAIATDCTPRTRNVSEMPRNSVMMKTATHKQNAAEAAIRRPMGHCASNTTGTSLFLIAVGAILYFAVDATVSGLEIQTVGLILMIIGVLGLLISFFFLTTARRTATERTVVRDREPPVY